MTVSTSIRKVSYPGPINTAIPLAVAFLFLEDGDLTVEERVTATGVLVKTWVITTDYTLVGAGVAAGGTLTTVDTVDAANTLYIVRYTTQTQGTDYVENDAFPADSHETALDRSILAVQDMQEDIDRAIKAPVYAAGGISYDLPTPVAGRGLKWDDAGTALENSDTDINDFDTHVTAAAASAAAAATSETNSATSETNAATSETNSATSETNAANSAAAAQAAVAGLDVTEEDTPALTAKVLTGQFRANDGASYISVAEASTGTLTVGSSGNTMYTLIEVDKSDGTIVYGQTNEVATPGDPYSDTPQPAAGHFALASVALAFGDSTIEDADITDLRNRFNTNIDGSDVAITDAGAYFATDNVEAALQELGAATTSAVGSGSFTYTVDASGSSIVSHGLGAVPKRITFFAHEDSSNLMSSAGHCIYNGTTIKQSMAATGADKGATGSVAGVNVGASNHTRGAVTAIDGTNFTVTWTETGTVGSIVCTVYWTAES